MSLPNFRYILIFLILLTIPLGFLVLKYPTKVENKTSTSKTIPTHQVTAPSERIEIPKRIRKLTDELPPEKKTGRGIVPLGGNKLNAWGVIKEIRGENLVLDVRGRTLVVFLTPSTKFSARPKGSPGEDPQKIMAETVSIAKNDLTAGQEVEVVADLVGENRFEAQLVSVLR